MGIAAGLFISFLGFISFFFPTFGMDFEMSNAAGNGTVEVPMLIKELLAPVLSDYTSLVNTGSLFVLFLIQMLFLVLIFIYKYMVSHFNNIFPINMAVGGLGIIFSVTNIALMASKVNEYKLYASVLGHDTLGLGIIIYLIIMCIGLVVLLFGFIKAIAKHYQ